MLTSIFLVFGMLITVHSASCNQSEDWNLTTNAASFGCDTYTDNLVLTWLISILNINQRINLTINPFQSLDGDVITVYDGYDSTFPQQTWTGDSTKTVSVLSSGPTLFVMFTSDSTASGITNTSFSLSYVAFGSFYPPCYVSANNSLTRTSGNFGCDGYANNVVQIWNISLPDVNQRINLTLDSLATESCCDILTVYDGWDMTFYSQTFSGSQNATSVISSSRPNLLITFQSDASNEGAGFLLSYDSTYYYYSPCYDSGNFTLNRPSAIFGCDGYGSNILRAWKIGAPNKTQTLNLTINWLHTESSDDVLKVYDGEDSTAFFSQSYSGIVNGSTFRSTGPYLYIVFSSDSGVEYSGFYLNYFTNAGGKTAPAVLASFLVLLFWFLSWE